MKKIAHVIGSKRLTADVLAVAEIARHLGGRFSFDILIPRDAEYRELMLGVGARVISFGDPNTSILTGALEFARYFRANHADIVHTHVSIAARVGARLAGIKTCISTRSFKKAGGRSGFRRLAAPIYNAFTTATICFVPCLCESLLDDGVKEDRIISLLPEGALCRRRAYSSRLSATERLIVCPLPFFKGFGQKTLIRAFSRLKKVQTLRLVFVGEGPELDECKLLASGLGVRGRVEFFKNEKSTNIYNMKPDILVFPQEVSWEFPLFLLNGCASRILASDILENRSILSGIGEFFLCGDEFSLERAILRSLTDTEQRNDTNEAIEVTESPLELICEAHERIYTALLSL